MATQPQKYCDLVMKGGLTSGVVYPSAVLELRKNFRFKNIGGTSAGAIAAAVTAAAAVGDRKKATCAKVSHSPNQVGFEGMEAVAGKLAEEGFVYSLFQPKFRVRNAFRVVVVLAGKKWWIWKLIVAFFCVIAIAPIEFAIALAAFGAIGYYFAEWDGVWAASAPAVLCAYAAALVLALLRVARVVRKNLLGLCSGLRVRGWLGKRKPALTEWLHGVLQELSGKPLDGEGVDGPLTFADLRGAPRYDKKEPQTKRVIDLCMITSGISHREPRSLPFERGQFWFLREEFELLFPKSVVAWMIDKKQPLERDEKEYFPLPKGDKLPVLVAMRMSLSFPLLLSAVPLHEPCKWRKRVKKDEEDDDDVGPRERNVAETAESLSTGGADDEVANIEKLRVCWFSDGGISSNFPIHLFDAPLPLWPTFAINLLYPKSDGSERPPIDKTQPEDKQIQASVFFPPDNSSGWQHTYQSIAHWIAAREVADFAFGVVSTMQNWRDLLLSRAPGQRDRIVHVSLWDDEGGMNLNMPQPVLTRIFKKGTVAGKEFDKFSFENHYWIRWRNLASAMQRYSISVADSSIASHRVPAYEAAYETAVNGRPVPPSRSYEFTSEQREEAKVLLDYLFQKESKWDANGPDLTPKAPRPLPQLQITPIY